MEHSLEDRWLTFSNKIKARQHELLVTARTNLKELLVSSDYDYGAVERAWHAMHTQIETLGKKVEDTYEQIVANDDTIADSSKDSIAQQKNRLLVDLYETLLVNEAVMFGEISSTYFTFVTQRELAKSHVCQQCSAPIKLRTDIFRAQYISCEFCQSTTTVTPETRFIQAGWNPLNHLARYKTLHLYKLYARALAESTYNHEDPSTTDTYEKTYVAYMTQWHIEKSLIDSELTDTLENDTAASLQSFSE